MDYVKKYFEEVSKIAATIDMTAVDGIARDLAKLRERGGRLFFLGVGGSAANCSHAVNDFRKLAGIETYSPCDNVAELTARTNDEGWETVFEAWLKTSRANEKDAVFVLSVGGGSAEKNVSVNLVRALDEAKKRGVSIYGIVGPNGGYTAKMADKVVKIPVSDSAMVTPHTEAFQGVVWHGIVCHPDLVLYSNKWEGLRKS